MRLAELKQLWDRIWFEPTSPSPICLYRILYGLLVLSFGFLLLPDLINWYGKGAVISQQAVHDWENSESRFSIFFLYPDSNALAISVFALLMIAATCLTLGLYTRLSAFIVFICLLSFHQRMACIFNAGDTILRQHALLLTFSQAGALYSIDRLRRNKSNPQNKAAIEFSPWAQRLLQLQIAGAYCQTFCSKMQCDAWLDGTALYYCSRLADFARLPVPFLFDHLWTCQFLSWMTLVVEFCLFTLIWVKEFRYPVLIAGTIFHLGIDWSMNIPLFEYIMIASYVNFLEPKHADRIVHFCKSLIVSPFQKLTTNTTSAQP